jgi:SDR family mycofactocin-dependent oxidoreductase
MGLMEGKVVVITGAARGQGRAHAVRFAEEGADVIAMDICRDVETVDYPGARPEDLAETVAAVEDLDRRIVATETDVRDRQAVEDALRGGVEELGRLDAVIANHGIASFVPAREISREAWTTMIDTNLGGVWNVCQAALPYLIDSGRGGAIVFTSSAASYVGFANCAHYSAAKAGLVGLMQSLAVELGPHKIRVNTIHPGTVDTPMAINDQTFELFMPGAGMRASSAEDRAKFGAVYQTLNAMDIPWLEAEDLANAAVYLCSDMGRYVTGVQLPVDAGQGIK